MNYKIKTELSNHRSLWKWLTLSLISSKCSTIKQHLSLKDDTSNRCLSKNESTCTLQDPIPPDAVATMMSPVPSRAGQSAMILLADFHSQVKRQSAPEKILKFIIGQQKANVINNNVNIVILCNLFFTQFKWILQFLIVQQIRNVAGLQILISMVSSCYRKNNLKTFQ